MREIVDKHFPDNWVINYYLGFIVDLSVAWEPYKAAKAALANTTQISNVTRLRQVYGGKIDQSLKQLAQYLTEVWCLLIALMFRESLLKNSF
jgi:WASH complex subunit strumpellin